MCQYKDGSRLTLLFFDVAFRYIGNTSGGRTLVKPMQPHDAPNPLVRSHTSSIEGITCSADGKHGTRWYTVVVVHRGGGTSWWYSCNLGY